MLITGATGGIGKHAALHLLREGYRVFATGRNPAKLDQLAAEAESVSAASASRSGGRRRAGGSLELVQLDVTSAESIEAARQVVLDATGGQGPDVLINNAGYGHAAPLELVDDDALRAQFETNVFGLLAVTRAFLPSMRTRGQGRILNVSSVGGQVSFPLMGAYTASKFAVEALSDSLRMELKPFGIDVILIEPGPIKTGFAHTSGEIADGYRGHGGAWQPVIDRSDALQSTAERFSADPQVVSNAIQRAIEARRPRARYVAPFSSAVLLAGMRLMPTRLLDWTMRQSMGLTRRALRGA